MSSKKFILTLILITGMLASPLMASALCTIEAKDEAKSHFVVETCTDIGTFSLGNYYNNWEELTYNYPQPWKGTFITINVDNKLYSNSPYAKGSVHMDPYVLKSPHIIGDSIVTKWRLPEGIIVEQKLEMIPDGSMIKIDIGNPTTRDMKVGVRISLDTKLYGKDGATIFIPGIGFIANEGVYTSEVGSL
ncbi:MAG: hypothetical protein KAU03_00090, partial [Candidatus Altiarchaeales archaeon]|nr:hypothetical protein [Candidatus Altiarchaeales archaeon]